MKAYLFNTESGFYEGEVFEEAAMLAYEDGITLFPPPDYEHGQVPMFDSGKNEWTVISITVARHLLANSTSGITETKA